MVETLGGSTGVPIGTVSSSTYTFRTWCDLYSLAELKEDFGTTLTDSALRRYLDGALEMVFGYIGHSFGQALWIYHDGSGSATAATVAVSSLGVLSLVITGGTYAGTDTFTLTSYTMWTLATAIEALEKGWRVKLVTDPEQPALNLRVTTSPISVYGYTNQRPLCLCSWTEIHSGNGETRLFLKWPFRSVVSVIEDGTTLTEDTDFWSKREGWLIREIDEGSHYRWYSPDTWSVKEPNNITVKYVPWWIGPVPSVVARVLMGLVQYLVTETGYHSEKIGDYSYTKNGNNALTWLQMLDGLGTGFSSYASGVAGGLW